MLQCVNLKHPPHRQKPHSAYYTGADKFIVQRAIFGRTFWRAIAVSVSYQRSRENAVQCQHLIAWVDESDVKLHIIFHIAVPQSFSFYP